MCRQRAALLGASVFVGSAQAAPRLCDDGSRPPCKDTGEATPTNNLAYPVIWSDGVSIVAPLPQAELDLCGDYRPGEPVLYG